MKASPRLKLVTGQVENRLTQGRNTDVSEYESVSPTTQSKSDFSPVHYCFTVTAGELFLGNMQ